RLKMITAVVTVLALAGLGLGGFVSTRPSDPPAPPQAPEPPRAAGERVVADQAQPRPLRLLLQAPPPVSANSVAVPPAGPPIAPAADGVRLYDARTGALLRAIGGAGDRGVAFAPDGRTLAAAGFHMDKLVGIYDVQTGKRVQNLAGHTEWETD